MLESCFLLLQRDIGKFNSLFCLLKEEKNNGRIIVEGCFVLRIGKFPVSQLTLLTTYIINQLER